jgi:hypothetical protein
MADDQGPVADPAPIDLGDRWVVPVSGPPIVLVDFAVTLQFTFGFEVVIRIENVFTYRDPSGTEHVLDPEGDPVGLAPVLALARVKGREATAWLSGELEVRFENGATVRVGPGDKYESWQLAGDRGFRLVSKPAATGLSVWSPIDP